jgi:hypothetical protein
MTDDKFLVFCMADTRALLTPDEAVTLGNLAHKVTTLRQQQGGQEPLCFVLTPTSDIHSLHALEAYIASVDEDPLAWEHHGTASRRALAQNVKIQAVIAGVPGQPE